MVNQKQSSSDKPLKINSNFKNQILEQLQAANRRRDEERQAAQQITEYQSEVVDALSEEVVVDSHYDEPVSYSEAELTEIESIVSEIEETFTPDSLKDDPVVEELSDDSLIEESETDYDLDVLASTLEHSTLTEEALMSPEEATHETAPFMEDDEVETFETEEVEKVEESAEEVLPDQVESEQEQPVSETDVVDSEEETITDEEEDPVALRDRRIKQISNRIVFYLITTIILFSAILGFVGWRYVSSGIQPLDETATEYIQVEIPEGSGNKLIGEILEDSGVIKSGTIFNYYTKFNNHTNFLSGYYNFQASMSLEEIVAALQEGGTSEPTEPVLGRILIPEGYTIDQIASAVEVNSNSENGEATPFTSEEFLKVVTDSAFIAQMEAKYPDLLNDLPLADNVAKYQLEGYLFPATYDYYEGMTMEELVENMISAMNTNLSPYYEAINASNMNVNEVLTLASLVEKEGSTDKDRKLIAGVFVNRINQGVTLGSNISILYLTGQLGSTETTLADDASIDTSIDSPYNTYTNYGLMPGPVDNPGLSAIKAAIEPESTDYMYFVADVTTGEVYYSEDYETHQVNVEKYVNSQLAGTEGEAEATE